MQQIGICSREQLGWIFMSRKNSRGCSSSVQNNAKDGREQLSSGQTCSWMTSDSFLTRAPASKIGFAGTLLAKASVVTANFWIASLAFWCGSCKQSCRPSFPNTMVSAVMGYGVKCISHDAGRSAGLVWQAWKPAVHQARCARGCASGGRPPKDSKLCPRASVHLPGGYEAQIYCSNADEL